MHNVVIIGGGPAGLSAAIYLARAGLSPIVLAGSPPGGQLILTSEVENYPGFESILGPELIEKMRKHAQRFGAMIVDENVVKVDFAKKPFRVFGNWKLGLDAGQEGRNKKLDKKNPTSINQLPNTLPYLTSNFISAKSIIIATGAKALWLGLESEKRLRGKGVSACATCDGFFFRDKTVAVVGGGDTAMEEALTLTRFAKKVYLIHRRDSFRASKIMQERVIHHRKIEIIWSTIVEEILGENKVTGIKVKSQKLKVKSSSQKLEVDGLFIAIGHKPNTELFKGQVELDEKGYVITSDRFAQENLKFEILNFKSNLNDQKFKNLKLKIQKFDYHYASQTSVSGIFAAGDCVDYQYRQAGTAVGMGIAAALEVEHWLGQRE